MRNCHVFHLEKTQGEDHLHTWDFAGNKPALPPLTTEAVASIVYLVEDEPKN